MNLIFDKARRAYRSDNPKHGSIYYRLFVWDWVEDNRGEYCRFYDRILSSSTEGHIIMMTMHRDNDIYYDNELL